MGLFNRKNVISDEEKRSLVDYFAGFFSYNSRSKYNNNLYLSVSSVYRAVNLISDSVASLQLKIYEIDNEGYRREYIEHPLYHLLGTEPNKLMGSFIFFKMIVSSVLLNGNAYIQIIRDKNFKPINFYLHSSTNIKPEIYNDKLIYYNLYTNEVINKDNMIHIINYPIDGSLEGQSTLSYARQTIQLAYDSNIHAGKWYKSGANNHAFLVADNALNEKQTNNIKTAMSAAASSETGGITILSGLLNTKFIAPTISPKDSQLLEARQFQVVEIARFFNINPIMLFDNTRTTYSNTENAQLDFLNTTLKPLLEKIENEFSRKLIFNSDRNNLEISFDTTNLMRLDTTTRADYYSKMIDKGLLTINEVRKMENLPKSIGDAGDIIWISTNLQDANNPIVNVKNSVDNKLI